MVSDASRLTFKFALYLVSGGNDYWLSRRCLTIAHSDEIHSMENLPSHSTTVQTCKWQSCFMSCMVSGHGPHNADRIFVSSKPKVQTSDFLFSISPLFRLHSKTFFHIVFFAQFFKIHLYGFLSISIFHVKEKKPLSQASRSKKKNSNNNNNNFFPLARCLARN